MEIETIGKYQLHLFAVELDDGRWDPYLSIMRFDDSVADFRYVLEKYPVPGAPYPDYRSAIEAARLAGNGMLDTRIIR